MDFFHFANPWFLVLLIAVPLLAWLLGKRGPDAAVRFSSVTLMRRLSGIRHSSAGKVMMALRMAALVCMIIAFARPQKGESSTSVQSNGIDIVVTIDLSYSMKALDLSSREQVVTRLDAAKQVVDEFIDKRSYDRIGLIAFGSESFVLSPLTLNHGWLKQNLARLMLGSIDGSSTAIGTALAAAVNRLESDESESRVVILLTDGENNAGAVTPIAAARAARALGIKVYTIATGKQGRVPVPRMTRQARVVRDSDGQPVFTGQYANSAYNEAELREIAALTGGQFFKATQSGDLERIYETIDQLETTEVELQSHASFIELYMWPLMLGLALFGIEQLLGNTRYRKLP